MMQPMDRGLPLEDFSLGGVNSGAFVRRAEYICQEAACLSCGKCMEVCPTKAIFLHRSCPVIDPCLCIDCGWCEERCPVGAILRTVQLAPV